MDAKYESAVELLKNPNAVVSSFDKTSLNEDDVKSNEEYLKSLSNSEIEQFFPEILTMIADGVCEANPTFKIIYEDIKREKSEPKKSIDFETAKNIVEFVKENLEAIAALISILQSLGVTLMIKKKGKNVK